MQIWKIRIVDCNFAKKNLLQMANALVLVSQLSHNGTKAFLLSHWNTFTPMYIHTMILWNFSIFFTLPKIGRNIGRHDDKEKIFQDFATWIINSIATLKWLWTNCISQRLAPVDTSHLKFKLEKKKIKEGVYHKSTKLG